MMQMKGLQGREINKESGDYPRTKKGRKKCQTMHGVRCQVSGKMGVEE